MVVGSDAEPHGAEAQPPPDTDAEFVSDDGASAATSTTTVIDEYELPAGSTSLRVQVTTCPDTEQVFVPEPSDLCQPEPAAVVGVSPAGTVSLTVTAPLVGPTSAPVAFDTV